MVCVGPLCLNIFILHQITYYQVNSFKIKNVI